MIIQPAGDAVIHKYRHKRCRHKISVQPLNNIITANLEINEVFKLRFISFHKFFVGAELSGIAGLWPDLLTAVWVHTIEAGQLKYLRPVYVAC